MPTTTTNYSWNKPTVGGDEDAWGGFLNGNWDALDTLLGGVTNTEFEILDGAAVSTAELNYVSGVTSAIQTQLDAKMAPTYTGDVDITGELIVDSYNETYAAVTSSSNATTVTSLTILFQTLEQLFSDYDPKAPPKLTLSSIHKSKGLEWPTVYLLGRNAWMPSKFATQDWMLDQEHNLTYVAITRAKETLYEITVTDE